MTPMNRVIRLLLGQLQEKLHMSLEAIATYTAMIDAARPAGAGLPPGLYTRRAERERTRALLIARYRRAVLLVDDSVMADWFAHGQGKRARRHSELRNQLAPWLSKRSECYTHALLDPVDERVQSSERLSLICRS
jgi:hypothetical protein